MLITDIVTSDICAMNMITMAVFRFCSSLLILLGAWRLFSWILVSCPAYTTIP